MYDWLELNKRSFHNLYAHVPIWDTKKCIYHDQFFLLEGSYGSWIYNYLCNQMPITTNLVSSIHTQARCIRYNIIW
jgi:hypothetical protein